MSDPHQLRKLLALKEMRKQRCREELATATTNEARWANAARQAERDHRRAERTATTYVQHQIATLPATAGLASTYTSLVAGAVTAHHIADVFGQRARARKQQSGVATAHRQQAGSAFTSADASTRRFEEMLSRLERIAAAQAELRAEDESAELASRRAEDG